MLPLKTLALIRVSLRPRLGHALVDRLDADLVEDQVGRGVVGVDDHQPDGVAERERGPVARSARSGCRCRGPCRPCGSVSMLVELDLALVGLQVASTMIGSLMRLAVGIDVVGVERRTARRCRGA